MSIRRKRTAVGLGVVTLVAAMAVASFAGGGGRAERRHERAPARQRRSTRRAPRGARSASFNPLRPELRHRDVLGLLYETLFRYDPLKDKFIPWLATSGKWVGKSYRRDAAQGRDVERRQAAHGRRREVHVRDRQARGLAVLHDVEDGPARASPRRATSVRFNFKGGAELPGLGHQHVLDPDRAEARLVELQRHRDHDGQHRRRAKQVGTGPFKYGAGKGTSQTLQWNRRAGWWATKALGMRMPMQYIVDIHNTSNTASLQNFLQGNIDLSNNFFPGIDKQIGGKISTYYTKAPYMLSANTAWLVPNTTHKPLNDKAFRRALATSININQIVTADYGNIVAKANPTGLLPTWSKWIDQAQAKKLGFTYSIARAKALLAGAGYRDSNGDGFVENKDGSNINLRIIVPNGWSDWMTAIQIIADSAKDAGIKITPAYPDYNGLVDERNSGKFDLVINNDKQIGNTPYTYYDYLFHLPIADQQTFANFSRFTEAGAAPWALTLKLNKMPTANVAKAKKIHSQIQKYILEDLPAIPLWYNGMWAQYNTSVLDELPELARAPGVRPRRPSGTATST